MSAQHFTLAIAPSGINLNIQLGTYKKQFIGLKTLQHVPIRLKIEVSAIIIRYVNHRERALGHYGQLTPSRQQAIQRIKQRFAVPDWRAEYLKPKLLGIASDLIQLLPAPDSRYYKNQQQLVADILDFAHNYHPTQFQLQ